MAHVRLQDPLDERAVVHSSGASYVAGTDCFILKRFEPNTGNRISNKIKKVAEKIGHGKDYDVLT